MVSFGKMPSGFSITFSRANAMAPGKSFGILAGICAAPPLLAVILQILVKGVANVAEHVDSRGLYQQKGAAISYIV